MVAALLLFVPLLWITWGWHKLPHDKRQILQVTDIMPRGWKAGRLGPFELGGLWKLDSPHSYFGGWSALLLMPSGQFLALSDRNMRLRFSPPGVVVKDIPQKTPVGIRKAIYLKRKDGGLEAFDIESAVLAPDKSIWFGLENDDRLIRVDEDRTKGAFVRLAALRDWPENGGAEAMTRLADGRWMILCETCGGRRDGLHLGLLFADYPDRSQPQKFGLVLPVGHDPVDMATLPDGRLLILTRRLVFFPLHFESTLVLADPAKLDLARPWATQELARIDDAAVRENYEGMALRPTGAGLEVWLISDANGSALQETRLMKLCLDLKRLPG